MAVPVVVVLFLDHYAIAGVIVFEFACATDWADGRLARWWKCESEFGRVLDSIADKAICGAGMLSIISNLHIEWWLWVSFVVILVYDFGILIIRYGFGIKLSTTTDAKVKTAVLMIGISVVLFSLGLGENGSRLFDVIGRYITAFGAGCAILSGVRYFSNYRYHRSFFRLYGAPPV